MALFGFAAHILGIRQALAAAEAKMQQALALVRPQWIGASVTVSDVASLARAARTSCSRRPRQMLDCADR